MKVRIYPYSGPGKAVAAPPSKSMAHRLLICAGLACGTSRIGNIALSEDILATADCLRAMGASVTYEAGSMTMTVEGADPALRTSQLMQCRESGSTLRFMLPVCALSDSAAKLSGSGRLMQRPLSVYEAIFDEQGLLLEKTDQSVRIKGKLRGGEFCVPGNISSQFVSGLLFALPLCSGDSVIKLDGSVESRPYIDMTLRALEMFGVKAGWRNEVTLEVPGGQCYEPAGAAVEGDWSNAAYLMAAGAQVTGLDQDSIQGDRVCREYFRMLDEGPAELNITDCPDLGPVLMAYAAMHSGCTLYGTERLRYKESDRGAAMKEELLKFGTETRIYNDRITVAGGIAAPSVTLSGHNDHRIVMALAALCTKTGGCIDGAEAVSKSFPDYFDKLHEMGVGLEPADS